MSKFVDIRPKLRLRTAFMLPLQMTQSPLATFGDMIAVSDSSPQNDDMRNGDDEALLASLNDSTAVAVCPPGGSNMPGQIIRSPNWTELEKTILVSEFARHRGILTSTSYRQSPHQDGAYTAMTTKKATWRKITRAINARGIGIERTVKDVHKKWQNLCYHAKKEIGIYRIANQAAAFSGEQPPALPKALYLKIWDLHNMVEGKSVASIIGTHSERDGETVGLLKHSHLPASFVPALDTDDESNTMAEPMAPHSSLPNSTRKNNMEQQQPFQILMSTGLGDLNSSVLVVPSFMERAASPVDIKPFIDMSQEDDSEDDDMEDNDDDDNGESSVADDNVRRSNTYIVTKHRRKELNQSVDDVAYDELQQLQKDVFIAKKEKLRKETEKLQMDIDVGQLQRDKLFKEIDKLDVEIEVLKLRKRDLQRQLAS